MFIAISSIALFFLFLYTSEWSAKDFGVFEIRKDYEYNNIDKNPSNEPVLKISLDRLPNNEQLERYVLPIEHEEVDERLFAILEAMEGDSSKITYFKGLIKAFITGSKISRLKDVGHYGGGSNLIITASGNLLENYSDISTKNKYLFRLNEIRLANHILSLDPLKQKKIILSQTCMVNNARGCTATSAIMFNKLKPTTDKERLILASSIRFPITESNRERLVMYANKKCHALKNHKDLDVGECNLSINDFIPKITISEIRLTGEIVPFCEGEVKSFPQKQSLANKVKKVVNNINANIEVSIMRYLATKEDFQQGDLLARCSNNELIVKDGFDKNQNISSTAKLFLILSDSEMPKKFVKAMQDSDNDEINKIAKERLSQMDIESKFDKIGIKPVYHSDFFHAISHGHISMSSNDMHKFLFALLKYSNSEIKKQGARAALNGTLSYLKPNITATKTNIKKIHVAKSGTHAIVKLDDPKLEKGIHGYLAVFALEKDQYIYTVVIRIHSKKNSEKNIKIQSKQQPICFEDNCKKTPMQELVDASLFIIQNQPKSPIKE